MHNTLLSSRVEEEDLIEDGSRSSACKVGSIQSNILLVKSEWNFNRSDSSDLWTFQ